MEEILKILPQSLVKNLLKICNLELITEIRIRNNRPVIVYEGLEEHILLYIAKFEDFKEILAKLSNNSIYAIQKDINQGFLMVKGGHRIGVCGEVIFENNQLISIKNVNSMNIRVASQKVGIAKKILEYIIKNNSIENTLIISPPRYRKNYFT